MTSILLPFPSLLFSFIFIIQSEWKTYVYAVLCSVQCLVRDKIKDDRLLSKRLIDVLMVGWSLGLDQMIWLSLTSWQNWRRCMNWRSSLDNWVECDFWIGQDDSDRCDEQIGCDDLIGQDDWIGQDCWIGWFEWIRLLDWIKHIAVCLK